jgi:hypothetical protein
MPYVFLEYETDRCIRSDVSCCRLKPLRILGVRFPVNWRKGVEQMTEEKFLNF